MRAALVGAIALVFAGCATGAADDTSPHTDAGTTNDSEPGADATLHDASGDSSASDGSPTDSTTSDASVTDSSSGDSIGDGGTDAGADTSTIPDTTTTPDTTAAPDTTVTPDTTPVPDTTITPDTTPVPDTTPIPDTTPVPDTTPIPDTMPIPDTTPVPDTTITPDTTVTCPAPVTLGNFDSSADAWTFDTLWRYDSGSASMIAGSTTKFSSSYTQNLTSPTNVDVSSCAAVTLSFSVRLADDPDYTSKGPDKSERLYVQCSGDGGGTWTNLTPSTWPTSQSPCATSYCCGGPGAGRSFPLTAQSIVLPVACRTTMTRIRFQAKGSSAWNLQNPGWYVDGVKLN